MASKITAVDAFAPPQPYALAAAEEQHGGKDIVSGDGDDHGDHGGHSSSTAGGGHDDDGHSVAIAPTRVPEWICDIIEKVFKIRKRKTTVEVREFVPWWMVLYCTRLDISRPHSPPKMECFCGVVQFISCLYVLPVVPFQLKRVGYDETASIVATTVTCAIGSIVSSFLTDMPLIIAPPTSVSIFLAVSMQQANLDKDLGCAAVILSGAGLVVIGAVPPVARFISKVRCVFVSFVVIC